MTDDQQILLELLQSELQLMDNAKSNLQYSYDVCKGIDVEMDTSQSDLMSLDSFSARFLRLYQVYTNQVLRTILQLLGEYQQTRIDNMHKAEKLTLVTSAVEINTIRILKKR